MPKEFSRTDAILQAAKQTFLRNGYDATSMDQIAEAAGTTKRTLYNHFDSKERLFEAIVKYTAQLASANLQTPGQYHDDPAEAVAEFCLRHAYWSSWTDAIAMQRIVIALVPRFPQYARLMYTQTLENAERILATYLTDHFSPDRFSPFETASGLARFLLYGVTGERRLLALMDAQPAYPAPTNSTPFADLPEERTIRALVKMFLSGRV